MNVSPIIKYRTLNLAQALAPQDTGNLRFNAIRIRKNRKSKWTINYSSQNAHYIEPLQEGWRDSNTGKTNNIHKGFIDKTVILVANYVTDALNGGSAKNYNKYRGMANDDGNNWRREMRNLRSKAMYKETKELEERIGGSK